MAALGRFEDAVVADIAEVLDVERLEQEDKLRLNLLFVSQHLHVRLLETLDHFSEHLEDAVEPRVLNLEDYTLGALFDDVASERDHELTLLGLEALDQHLFDVHLVRADRSVFAQSQLTQKLA